MNEEHTSNPSFESRKGEPTPEADAAELTDISVELKLDAIAHESLNWQDMEESVSQCIAPEVLEALQQEMEQVLHKNVALLDRISQLENALAHSQQALQTYQERQPATEALLSQRLEEINTLQEENQRLSRELEQSHQNLQRQQILVQTLTEQLESSQTQVAQLERDCAIAQQRSHQQATQLNQRDKFCIDLQTRLHRQQRYTLQFKNALDRCLELSPSSREQILKDSSGSVDHPKVTKIEQGLTPKVVAIQPWSIHQWQDTLSETEQPDPMPEEISPRDSDPKDAEPSCQESLEPDNQTPSNPVNPPHLHLFKSEDLSPSSPEIPPSPRAAIDGFQESQFPTGDRPEAFGTLEVSEDLEPEPPSFSAEFDDSEQSWIEPEDQPEQPQEEEAKVTSNASDNASDNASEPTADPEHIPPSEDSLTLEPSEEPSEVPVNLPQGNWPSPLVYPLRPPKKLKSLAAIKLPSFPRR